jgi:hypothetical protein
MGRRQRKEIMSRLPSLIALALLPVLAGCASDKAGSSAATTPATPTRATTPAPSSPPVSQPPSTSSAADGRDLTACRDGECEVVIKRGDVLRFGPAVKTKPKVDRLTVVDVGDGGPVFALPSGMTTTANGGVEINGGLGIETGIPEGNCVAIRISRIR